MADSIARAQQDAEDRIQQRSRRLRPLGWVVLAIVWASALHADPAPSTHGRGAAVLVVLLAYSVALTLAIRPTRWAPTVERRAAAAIAFAALGIALALLQPHHAQGFAADASVFVLAMMLRGRAALITCVAVVVGIDVALAFTPDVGVEDVATLTLLCALLGTTGTLLRRASDGQDETELLYAQLREARDAQAAAAAMQERARIAGELHDVLAHSLSGAAIQLQGARRLLERDPAAPATAAAVDRAAELVKDGLADARRAVGALRGDALPTIAQLPGLIDDVRRDTGLDVAFRATGTAADLSPEAQVALYRGAQEALTNAVRYAPGSQVTVALEHAEAATSLTVTDHGADGAPSPAIDGGGHGLSGMRERVGRAGGTMEAGPTADGWRVHLEVPA